MKKNHITIAVDGPSGAGKSTLSRLCAGRFGLIYIDTGAMYRTVGLYVRRAGFGSKDAEAIISLLPAINIELKHDDDGLQRMLLNGADVSDEIRLPVISVYASDVSAVPEVRKFLLGAQRELAKRADVIMDGRDIGTVVLPDSGLKLFLTATAQERAGRRYIELIEKGVETTFEEVLKDMDYRDKNDAGRSAAPLKPAPDAVILDTTGNTLEQSFELLTGIIAERFGI